MKKNRKAIVISIAVLLALLAIGSASATVAWHPTQGPQGGLMAHSWGSKGKIKRLNDMIKMNKDKISQLDKELKESKTKLTRDDKKEIKNKIKSLKKQNKEHEREIRRLKSEPRS